MRLIKKMFKNTKLKINQTFQINSKTILDQNSNKDVDLNVICLFQTKQPEKEKSIVFV